MIATIIIALLVAGLLLLAVRHLAKNGACAACELKSACPTAGKNKGECAPCCSHTNIVPIETIHRHVDLVK